MKSVTRLCEPDTLIFYYVSFAKRRKARSASRFATSSVSAFLTAFRYVSIFWFSVMGFLFLRQIRRQFAGLNLRRAAMFDLTAFVDHVPLDVTRALGDSLSHP